MRRWDIVGLAVGLATSVLDLFVFSWAGSDLSVLFETTPGHLALGSFVIGYALFGGVCGRLYMARQRSRADAARIQAQLEALEDSRQQLAQSEKLAALGRLAAGIAHEVRNPLGVIRASASMVQDAFDDGTEDHRACELIVDEIDRLDGLIGALLAFARPARMELSPTELRPMVDRAATLAAEARDVRVEADVAPGLVVRADADLLTQVLLGFIVNAAEAGATRVGVRAGRDGAAIELTVADDGAGIAPEDEPRVFEPFFTTKDTGTGLGLSMATRIVEAHGGAVAVRRGAGLGDGGRGACFALTLPVEGPAVVTEAA